ncbi:hypothetical protein NQ318_000247 [Aromia moschata]|uniref:Peptidase aspartic putative domain-containing protein n=1 Tax=Aromia moschata TaxID=1265417 RepID=A0AAV8YUK9_9CUCU|nr:hypothetical protein NQ318_000247 [Aromia moschata]
MAETSALVAKRGSVKASITRIEKFIDDISDDVTVNNLKSRLKHLEELYAKYDDIQLNLEVINQTDFGDDRESIEDKYLNLKGRFEDLIEQKLAISVINSGVRSVNETSEAGIDSISGHLNENYAGLPKISLPQFDGNKYRCRALLDSASERNYVTEEFASNLNVDRLACDWRVSGVSGVSTKVKDTMCLTVQSRVSDFKFSASFGIMRDITGHTPKCEFDLKGLKWPRHISLADPTFNKVGKIDMLLGTEVFAKTMKKGIIDLGTGQPVLQNTEFGWVLTTVTYGTASASFLATRTLLQLVSDEGSKFPLASQAIRNNSYVDDIITGADNVEVTRKMQGELIELLARGGFQLHKWCSNEPSLLDDIPVEKREIQKITLTNNENSIRTLGIVWNPVSDSFEIAIGDSIVSDERNTKRAILSCIARIFDPLGFTGPTTALSKIIMQDIWKEKLGWDQQIPSHILKILNARSGVKKEIHKCVKSVSLESVVITKGYICPLFVCVPRQFIWNLSSI